MNNRSFSTSILVYFSLLLVISLLLSCKTKKGVEPYVGTAPSAPTQLRQLNSTPSTVTLKWNDLSSDESGFYIYWFMSSHWQIRDTAAAGRDTFTVTDLAPSSGYLFYVTAFNSWGESAHTNQLSVYTGSITVPTTPYNVTAAPFSPREVRLTWQGQNDGYRFLIARKDSGNWASIDSVANSTFAYHDTTARPLMHYWYKIGSVGPDNVYWSADSADAWTPTGNIAPNAPDSLHVEIHIGSYVVLTWKDMSDNETAFLIERGPFGQTPVVIDSVPANVTTYTDSLRNNIGQYNYRIRAKNAYGYSLPCPSVQADYRYCSNGIIPICIGNYWSYHRIQGGSYMQVVTSPAVFPNGHDYYLMVENNVDTLFYLRNFDGVGCKMLPFPLPANPDEQVLYHYPAIYNERYTVRGDTMLVTAINTTQIVNGVTYSGLITYQRITPTCRYTIWIEPETIGIVKIDSLNHSGSLVLSTRELTDYMVNNAP